LLGFGTWLADPGVVGEATQHALDCGYKHIDCACVYNNEAEIGDVISEYFETNTRDNLFITSKLWVKDFGKVRESCKLSLKKLQLEYLDLYLIHSPYELDNNLKTSGPPTKGDGVIGYSLERIQEVWKEMEKLVDEGLVKSIGISNFTIKKIKELMKNNPRIIPACNQVELHPYLPQNKLVEYCKSLDIAVVAYSPLGNPGRMDLFRKASDPALLQDEVIKDVANEHNITEAQVLIAWGLQRQHSVLVKSVNDKRLLENFESLKIKLDKNSIHKINSISTRHRYIDHCWGLKGNENIEDIWDDELLS